MATAWTPEEAASLCAADNADHSRGGAQEDGGVCEHGLAGPDLSGRHQTPATPRPRAHSEGELGRQHRHQAALLPHQLHGAQSEGVRRKTEAQRCRDDQLRTGQRELAVSLG